MAEQAVETNPIFGEGVSLDEAAAQLTQQMSAQPAEDEETGEEALEQEDTLEEQHLDAEEEEGFEEEEDSDEDLEEDSGEESDDLDWFEIEGENYSSEQLIEFKNSGLRLEDYTRKTQELAEERKGVSELKEQQVQLNTQYEQALEQAQQFLVVQMHLDGYSEENLQRIREEEGTEAYLIAKDEMETKIGQIRQLFAEQEQVRQQRAELQQQQFAQRQAEAATKLAEVIPEYGDAEKGPKLREGVSQMLTKEFGFTEAELGQIDDHRMFLVAHELHKARGDNTPEMRRKVAQKKVKKGVSPVVRPNSPKSKRQRRSEGTQKVVQRATQTGDPKATEAALVALMER